MMNCNHISEPASNDVLFNRSTGIGVCHAGGFAARAGDQEWAEQRPPGGPALLLPDQHNAVALGEHLIQKRDVIIGKADAAHGTILAD